MDRASAARDVTSNGSGPPPRRGGARRGMWSATLRALAHRSPLLTPTHVIEGVAGVTLSGWAVISGLVLVVGAPAAGDAAATAATAHGASVVAVAAQSEAIPAVAAPGDDPGSRQPAQVLVSYPWAGTEVHGVVSRGELSAASADETGAPALATTVWIDRDSGSIPRATQTVEGARMHAVVQRILEICTVLVAAYTGSRLVTSTSVRWRGRRWAREWQRWDVTRDLIPRAGHE